MATVLIEEHAQQLDPMARQYLEHIRDAAGIVARYQNGLGIASPVMIEAKQSDSPRHHLAFDFGRRRRCRHDDALQTPGLAIALAVPTVGGCVDGTNGV